MVWCINVMKQCVSKYSSPCSYKFQSRRMRVQFIFSIMSQHFVYPKCDGKDWWTLAVFAKTRSWLIFSTAIDDHISMFTCRIMSGPGDVFCIFGLYKGVHRSQMDSLHTGTVTRTYMQDPNELFNKQSSGRWPETPRRSYDVTVVEIFSLGDSSLHLPNVWPFLAGGADNRHVYCFHLNSLHHWLMRYRKRQNIVIIELY